MQEIAQGADVGWHTGVCVAMCRTARSVRSAPCLIIHFVEVCARDWASGVSLHHSLEVPPVLGARNEGGGGQVLEDVRGGQRPRPHSVVTVAPATQPKSTIRLVQQREQDSDAAGRAADKEASAAEITPITATRAAGKLPHLPLSVTPASRLVSAS